jgi:hypothetical protein
MPYSNNDKVIGGDWFSTIYCDNSVQGDVIYLSDTGNGLKIDMPDAALPPEIVHKLVLTLGRYERWLKASARYESGVM